jgi:DNA-binding response OmpR family regulator
LYLTTFTIKLPIGKEFFTKDEIIEETSEPIPDAARIEEEVPDPISNIQHPISNIKDHGSSIEDRGSSILIVEDNPDVTTYIGGFLEHDYRIFTAKNGKEGWKKTLAKYPDLIISDVMMPEMDGFELCKKIKSDQRTSHIPVILLTAKADLDSRMEGLEFGADDYISKPFEARELQARSSNLIEQRRNLREKFSRQVELNPREITASSMDEQFLQRLMDVFENHISDSDFNTESLAREVGMSRSNLYRKIQALTNQSTHDFILSLRLKRAAQLLDKKSATVSEVAYAVGFNSPSHFSKVFRREFGQSPSDFTLHHNSD